MTHCGANNWAYFTLLLITRSFEAKLKNKECTLTKSNEVD